MKVTILIDNTPDEQQVFESEHGLSMLVETENRRIIIDTGLSGKFINNARCMGISLENTDFCFLSHGHNDHSGGLRQLLENEPDTTVYLSKHILPEQYSNPTDGISHRLNEFDSASFVRYFTSRHGERRELSTDFDTLRDYADRLRPVEKSTWIADGIAAIYCTHNEYPKPLGNIFLSKEVNAQSVQDDFDHEMAMVIATDGGLVIFSSCSHNGAINIMKSCQDFTGEPRVIAFVGGLHFVDCSKTEQEITDFAASINANFPDTKIFTGHCTSDKAKRFLSEALPTVQFFRTGSQFEI